MGTQTSQPMRFLPRIEKFDDVPGMSIFDEIGRCSYSSRGERVREGLAQLR